ncbi:MAG: hypothetical protein RR661_00515, partial [Anaerovoracaceae bacterium]
MISKKAKKGLYFGGIWLIAGLTLAVLIIIIGYILIKGVPHITWEFLSQEPKAMGKEGGIFSIIIGTLYVTALSVIIATPLGVAAAVYFTEYSKGGR